VSFPSYGNAPGAFRATFSRAKATFNYVVVVEQLGHTIMVVSESYGIEPDLTQFESYVIAAAAKLSATTEQWSKAHGEDAPDRRFEDGRSVLDQDDLVGKRGGTTEHERPRCARLWRDQTS
jgi:hypothetical protein